MSAIDGVAGEAQRGSRDGDLEARGASGLPTRRLASAEGEGVHGAGGRHADVPVAEAARVVLHGGLRAGLDRRRRRVRRYGKPRRKAVVMPPAAKRRIGR